MRYPLHLIDAFTDRAFSGNPAAVMLLDEALPDHLMQAVAQKMDQAETAFVTPWNDAWDLCWFPPVQEAPFCGHATLAAAHVLAAEMGRTGEISFQTRRVGTLKVRIEQSGRYKLDLPRIEPRPVTPRELPFGVSGDRSAFRADEVVGIEVESEKDVRGFEPDFGLIAQHLAEGFCLTAPGYDSDCVSRFFWPFGGIPEDQVTGSLHATLVPFWAGRLGRDRLTAVQASRRGGRLDCELVPQRVFQTGSVITTLRGYIDLPD